MKKTKRQPIERDMAFAYFIYGKEFTSRLHEECLQLNKKINTPIKNGQMIYIDISPKGIHKHTNKHIKYWLISLII